MNNLIKLTVKNLILIVLAAAVAYASQNLPLSVYLTLSGGCEPPPIDPIGLPEDYKWPRCVTIYQAQIEIVSMLVFFVIYYLIFRILLRRLIRW